jgi:hypothetical protein
MNEEPPGAARQKRTAALAHARQSAGDRPAQSTEVRKIIVGGEMLRG